MPPPIASGTSTSIQIRHTVRSIDSFKSAADEAGISRNYGGIHYQASNLAGLHAQERRIRIGVEPRSGGRAQRRKVCRAAEVGEQQKASREVLAEHFGRVDAGGPQQAGDGDERPAIFVRRRRIHRNPRALADRDAEIAAEARVGRSRCDLERRGMQLSGQPLREKR